MSTVSLPAEFRSGNSVNVERATISRERMIEILKEAIEEDRKDRGEPIAWIIDHIEYDTYITYTEPTQYNHPFAEYIVKITPVYTKP